jgi:NAD(P)-dependent dehydrogenase (short-subunit alcohol dehydrogenase family)
VTFSDEGAYLLVGCLGGLGRSLTTWMLQRGCKNFVFLSRSGTAKPEAADVVGRLQDAGATVQVFCVDASDEQAVAGVVADVSATKPIKGVIHAAMVLQVSNSRLQSGAHPYVQ